MFFNHRFLGERLFKLGTDGKKPSDEALKPLTIMYRNQDDTLFSTVFWFRYYKGLENDPEAVSIAISLALDFVGDSELPLLIGTGTGATYVEASQDLERQFNELKDDASRPALKGLLERAGELTPVTT